jgi:SAM-dependent methyltransferase
MANFLPLKQYMLYCLDRFIERYELHGPFLEIGCGRGDVSAHLARKGWSGVAIDFSDSALAEAAANLAAFPQVAVRKLPLEQVDGRYACIIMWDVLEHIEDDRAALRAVERLLLPGARVLLAVPSNPREWRWDDDFYGHVRRYETAELAGKLREAGLEPETFWDFTFPLFWAMRRAYTRIKSAPAMGSDRDAATRASATVNAWELPLVSAPLERSAILWRALHPLLFGCFRGATARGHEFFALARKPATS